MDHSSRNISYGSSHRLQKTEADFLYRLKSLLSRDLFTHSSRFNKIWLAEQDLFLHLVGALFSNF